MKEVYQIQAAFVKKKALTTLKSRESYHFWRLMKETPYSHPEVVEVFYPSLDAQLDQNIAIVHWHVKTEVKDATEPNNYHMVYGGTKDLTDVQARWERAKEYLRSQSNSFHFNHRGPLDRITQYEMQNVIYNELAKRMGIKAYSFVDTFLFKQQIASQELLGSYTPRFIPSTLFSPYRAEYKIVSAINYNVLKSVIAVEMPQLKANKAIYHVCKGYHFWMLTVSHNGGQDKVIEVAQGLPTKRTKVGSDEIIKHRSIKTRNTLLAIHTFSPEKHGETMIPAHHTYTTYQGPDAAQIWDRMKNDFVPFLNNKEISYSFLGVGMSMFGGKATNGNSAYVSIGFIFETLINHLNNPPVFKIPIFESFAPGLNNPIVSRDAIQDYCDLSTSPTDSVNKFF